MSKRKRQGSGGFLFFVAARGGSIGVTHKNLRYVGGIPLVGLGVKTISRASKLISTDSGNVHKCVCSTDNDEIAEAAELWGASVVRRPDSLAGGQSPVCDAIVHTLDELGDDWEGVVMHNCTTPFTSPEDIVKAVELYRKLQRPVVSVTDTAPLAWNVKVDKETHALTPAESNLPYQRQAEKDKWYRLNGGVFVASVAHLREHRSFFTEATCAYPMPAERSSDIDTVHDLQMAQAVPRSRRLGTSEDGGGMVRIGDRVVGPGQPVFIIAEAGVNHNGSVELAHKLIDIAAKAGADAIKFQTFTAGRVVSATAPKPKYQLETTPNDESQLEMLRKLELPLDCYAELQAHCKRSNILFISTPFDEESADFLASIDVPAFKIASAETTNWSLLRRVAQKQKPTVLSTGMSTMKEVADAVEVMQDASELPDALCLLHCVSCYPTAPEDTNLRAMQTMSEAFNIPIGFSDHTLGLEVPIAAVATGYCHLYEKHFTLSRDMEGPDHRASLEPDELTNMVTAMRRVQTMLGDGIKTYRPSEENTRVGLRRSMGLRRNVQRGEVLDASCFRSLRPATGVIPNQEARVFGRKAARDLKENNILLWEDMEEEE